MSFSITTSVECFLLPDDGAATKARKKAPPARSKATVKTKPKKSR